MMHFEQLGLWLERLKSGMRLHRAEQIQVLEEYMQLRQSFDAAVQEATAKAGAKDDTIRALHVQIQSLTETLELYAKPKEEQTDDAASP